MSEDRELFRPEALRDWAAQRVEGQLLQISPGWTRWMYWLLLLVTVSALGFAAFAKVDRWVEGQAVARENGTVVAVFPESARTELTPGHTWKLRFEKERDARLVAVHEALLTPARWREAYPYAASLLAVEGPVLVAEFDAKAPAGTRGRVERRSGRVRVLDLLLPGLAKERGE